MSPSTPTRAQDISSPELWLSAHSALARALDVAAFAHPAVSRLAVRQDIHGGQCHVHVEFPRRARKPAAIIGLAQPQEALMEAWLAGMPGAEDQARSLSRIIAAMQPWAEREAASPQWALDLGASLGLGESERWDPNYDDGIARDTDGLEVLERSALEAHEDFPSAVEESLRAGSTFCEGSPQRACYELLAEFEAEVLHDTAFEAPAPPGALPPPAKNRRL